MLFESMILASIALIVSSITDIKKREVPDYVSYSLMYAAFAVAIFYSLRTWSVIPLAHSVMGFAIGTGLAYLMFYTGQWGGGDSKLLMGLGAVIGFNVFDYFGKTNYWFLVFLISIVFVSALYGMVWSVGLAIMNRKKFFASVRAWSDKPHIRTARLLVMSVVIGGVLLIFFFVPPYLQLLTLVILAVFYFSFYLWLFVKVVEESCMIKQYPVAKLTEGDWIVKPVYVGKKYITGPKELGITKKQIALLKSYATQGKIKTVSVKEGIPLVPAILLAFLFTVAASLYGWMSFLNYLF